jgi:DNA polymerase I-like protein with 3'-5' exonuclease and polymerase domains
MIPAWLEKPEPHKLYTEGKYVTLDFETTNLDKGSALNERNRLILACWERSWDGKVRYSWGDEFNQHQLLADLAEADFLVAHNVKFECQWLERIGFDIGSKPWWDTMNAEWVLSGNRRWQLNLDSCLRRRDLGGKMKFVSNLMSVGVCPSLLPKSLLLRYCIGDVRGTQQLFEHQIAHMESTSPRLVPVVFTRSQTAPVLASIERNGMVLDPERVEQEYEKTQQEFIRVSDELDELTGGINARSPVQVAQFVYGELGFKEKTDKQGNPIRNRPTKTFPDGQPKTDEATLLSLNATKEKQRRFLELKKEYAQLASRLDKNLKLFVGVCREQGGRLYGNLNQGITVTHRLASRGRPTFIEMFGKSFGCQFQNMPRIYKGLFKASAEDRYITELDGAQLEFRVAGHLGRDEQIKADIADKVDIHRYTASVINQCDESEVTKYQRTAAKAHTFKPLYGGQSGTADEQRYYADFARKYSGLARVQEKWAMEVVNHKMLETEWGMIAYWPDAKMDRTGYLNVKTNVYNWPVQSLATAEIIPIALFLFWHMTRHLDVKIINTVHDSIIVDHPKELLAEVIEIGNEAFTRGVYKYLGLVYNLSFSVPLGTGVKAGTHWSESDLTDEQLAKLIQSVDHDATYVLVEDGEILMEGDTND